MTYVLEMKAIEKSFSGVSVLKGVSLGLKPGEVHALMGENGAGKSTLMKILMGIYKADGGQVFLHGEPVHITGPSDALNRGIAMIHQELNPVLDMEVAENLFVGRELRKPSPMQFMVDIPAMRREAQKLFDGIGITLDPTAKTRTLSVAQMQLIEIAKAISASAKIVIMDEPTSAISDREVEVLFNQIRKLKAQGVAIIYISHKMDEIFEIADTITVLRDGQWVGTDSSAQLSRDQLIKMMVGREITDVYPKDETQPGEVLMEVTNMKRGRSVKDASFQLHRGEVLGIAGLVGAGRSELVESIFGLSSQSKGSVRVNGKELRIRHPKDAIRSGIALITEDRKGTGLNLAGTILENMTLVHLNDLAPFGVIDRKKEQVLSEVYMKRLRVKAPSAEVPIASLSGGNQQKVVLAKWLMHDPDIIIFDEPTRGIDIGAKRDIYLLIGELAKAGKAIVVISSELPEVMGISDRILVMCEGRITGELQRKDFSQEAIMHLASAVGETS